MNKYPIPNKPQKLVARGTAVHNRIGNHSSIVADWISYDILVGPTSFYHIKTFYLLDLNTLPTNSQWSVYKQHWLWQNENGGK